MYPTRSKLKLKKSIFGAVIFVCLSGILYPLWADTFIDTNFPWKRPLKTGEFGLKSGDDITEKKIKLLGEECTINHASDSGYLSFVSIVCYVDKPAGEKAKEIYRKAKAVMKKRFGKPMSVYGLSAIWQPMGHSMTVLVEAPAKKKYVEILFRYYGGERHRADVFPVIKPLLGIMIEGKVKNKLTRVFKNSPAEVAGIQKGDIITKAGNQNVKDIHDVIKGIKDTPWGGKVTIAFERDGKEQSVDVTFDVHPDLEALKKRWLGKELPNTIIGDDSGAGYRLFSKHEGKVILIHFWAGWCGDCINAGRILAQKTKANPKAGLTIVSPQARSVWNSSYPGNTGHVAFFHGHYPEVYRNLQTILMGVIFVVDSKRVVRAVMPAFPGGVEKAWQKAEELTK